MWFGDLVTMTWFDDVWMKEVFANFMAAKIVNPTFPDLDHDLRFLHTHYPAAYDVDRTAGANAIRQPLENLRDAGSLYGAIVYLKSPIVMRQLELLLGEPHCAMPCASISRFAFGHASWPDLLPILQARAPIDLASWSASWLERAGRPATQSSIVREPDGGWRVRAWRRRLSTPSNWTSPSDTSRASSTHRHGSPDRFRFAWANRARHQTSCCRTAAGSARRVPSR